MESAMRDFQRVEEPSKLPQHGHVRRMQFPDTQRQQYSRIEYIRTFEYTVGEMSDALRKFKSEIFQGLANPTRIAIVELLRAGEHSAGTLIEKLGIEQANASQHLAVLRATRIVVGRKAGNQVYYSIRDRALIQVLDILREYFYAQLSSTVDLLKEAAREKPKSRLSTHR
jgi:DNA-binding transcriptional ArsR family regulator